MTDEERVVLRVIANQLEVIAAELAAYYPPGRAATPHEWKAVEPRGAGAPERAVNQ